MKRTQRALLGLLLSVSWSQAAASGQGEPKPFSDPAPPAVRSVPRGPRPTASESPETKLLGAPAARDPSAVTEDWPSFLGPRRDSVSRETHLLRVWPKTGPKKLWEYSQAAGFAGPAIVGERVVTTHRVGDQVHVDCLDAQTGRRFWRVSRSCDYKGRYISDGGPRSQPVIDGERVWIHGVDGVLQCLDLYSGFVVWQRNLLKEFSLTDEFFGVVGTPLVVGERLIINVGARETGPTVAAFDKTTGKMLWGAGKTFGASCASPVLAEIHGRERVLVLAAGRSRPPSGGLMVLDPITGKVDFTHPFRSRVYESVLATSPVVLGNDIFLSAAYNVGSTVLRLDKQGGYEVVFASRNFGLQFGNAIAHDGLVFLVEGKQGRSGDLVCIDPQTGTEVWRKDLDYQDPGSTERSRSIGEGSLLFADGDFFVLSDDGHLVRVHADKNGAEVVTRATLFRAADTWTPPVIVRGLLYVRQNTVDARAGTGPRLHCYDLREPAKTGR